MLKNIRYVFAFLLTAGCIEPYEFVIKDSTRIPIIEASFSNKSYNDTRDYPSDGRYFTVKISYAGNVDNTRPEMMTGAYVTLMSDQGESWDYSSSVEEPGIYRLLYPDVKAEKGVRYKLHIVLADGNTVESAWESMPVADEPVMGTFSFVEREREKHIIELGEKKIVTVQGIEGTVALPPNTTGELLYYRWTFSGTWIYIPPFSSVIEPGYRCWATSPNYLNAYAFQEDRAGGYDKALFFMETVRNERIFHDFSVLVVQQAINKEQYFFWKEMYEQTQGGVIFDAPPYNLKTNFKSVGEEIRIAGYFSVVSEQAQRHYFNMKDLSYFIVNTLKRDCSVPYQDPAPECFDCRQYSNGIPSTDKPWWWH